MSFQERNGGGTERTGEKKWDGNQLDLVEDDHACNDRP